MIIARTRKEILQDRAPTCVFTFLDYSSYVRRLKLKFRNTLYTSKKITSASIKSEYRLNV